MLGGLWSRTAREEKFQIYSKSYRDKPGTENDERCLNEMFECSRAAQEVGLISRMPENGIAISVCRNPYTNDRDLKRHNRECLTFLNPHILTFEEIL